VPESRLRKVQHSGRFSIAKPKYLAQKQRSFLCRVERSTNAGETKRHVFFYLVPEVRLAHDCGQFLNLIWIGVQFLLSDRLRFFALAFALPQAIERQVRRDAKPPCFDRNCVSPERTDAALTARPAFLKQILRIGAIPKHAVQEAEEARFVQSKKLLPRVKAALARGGQ
jgi:hypothetical protein